MQVQGCASVFEHEMGPVFWKTTFSRLDINNQTTRIKFDFYDPTLAARGLLGDTACFGTCGLYLGIDRIENNIVKDTVLIPLKSRLGLFWLLRLCF